MNILIFIISLILSLIFCPIILKMLINSKALRPNYRGEKIPFCMGVAFIFVQTISLLITYMFFQADIEILYYLISIILIGLVGLLDDLIGVEDIKGLKGHLISFLKGNPTTGSLKAGIGVLISLLISYLISNNILDIIVNTLLIALFTNYNNIFDLRPGRSIKAFIFASIALLLTREINKYDYLIYSFYGLLLIYFPIDLKAKAMMGDAGSNVLGITLGIYCTLSCGLITKSIYLLMLIIVHIIAEKYSFTKIIDSNRILKFIDNLGR